MAIPHASVAVPSSHPSTSTLTNPSRSTITAKSICCTAPQLRIDTPEPPSRQPINLTSIDSIFAAAALPEDHPHAIKFPGDKKPGLASDIITSPGLMTKIRGKMKRNGDRVSKSDLRSPTQEDADAKLLGERYVLGRLEEEGVEMEEKAAEASIQQRFGTVPRARRAVTVTPGISRATEGRTSVLNNFEWMRPLLQNIRPSAMDASGESYTVIEVANQAAAKQHLSEIANGENNTIFFDVAGEGEEPVFVSPKSTSARELAPVFQMKRSSSACGIADRLTRPRLDKRAKSDGSLPRTTDGGIGLHELKKFLLPMRLNDLPASVQSRTVESTRTSPAKDAQTNNGVHLHNMHISQQLRSMSRASENEDAESLRVPRWPWNLHQREKANKSTFSLVSRHATHNSLGRVRFRNQTSPIFGNARPSSSVYSRPSSAGGPSVDREGDMQPYSIDTNLNALFADWPLKPPAEDTHQVLGAVSSRSAASENRDRPLPQSPADGTRKDSGTIPTGGGCGDTLMKALPPSPRRNRRSVATTSPNTTLSKSTGSSDKTSSIRQQSSTQPSSKRSSSPVMKGTKLGKQSPPKKIVRKRRSIFRFLRPGSRKQAARSISTPVLRAVTARNPAPFDGPSDDPALLTVQYELDEYPRENMRSMSVGYLGPYSSSDVGMQRQPTLDDYERKLSVAGDNRRRPSAVDLKKIQELEEEDHRESVGHRRRLSRARPLKDDANPLMAKALAQHRQEKACFHSASKERESRHADRPQPVFASSPFGATGVSLPPLSTHEQNDLLDPLEKGYLVGPMERSRSMGLLVPPGGAPWFSSQASSAKASTLGGRVGPSLPALRPAKLGTERDSWTQFPSHTRMQRCGSARSRDAVRIRDFAVDSPSTQGTRERQDTDTLSPDALPSNETPKPKKLLKTGSLNFSGLKRYYSNMFTLSTFSGHNRRTSITTGGRLEHPELELLPPQLPGETHAQRIDHTHYDYYLNRIKEDVGHVYARVKEEEDKLENFAHEEENKFEGFVRKEEEKLTARLHQPHHHQQRQDQHYTSQHHGRHHATSKGSPFRADKLFAAPSQNTPQASGSSPDGNSYNDALHRTATNVAPDEDDAPPTAPPPQNSPPPSPSNSASLRLDGAGATLPSNPSPPSQGQIILPSSTYAPALKLSSPPKTTSSQQVRSTPSYAEIWSDIYRECLPAPAPSGTSENTARHEGSSHAARTSQSMPPPPVPIKDRCGPGLEGGRVPDASFKRHISDSVSDATAARPSIATKGSVRHFPSVTVYDDRRGHCRSISLVSSIDGDQGKLSLGRKGEEGLLRNSTKELIGVVEQWEKMEREKLLEKKFGDGGWF